MTPLAPSNIVGELDSDHLERYNNRQRQIRVRDLALEYLRSFGGETQATDVIDAVQKAGSGSGSGWSKQQISMDLNLWGSYIVKGMAVRIVPAPSRGQGKSRSYLLNTYRIHPHIA